MVDDFLVIELGSPEPGNDELFDLDGFESAFQKFQHILCEGLNRLYYELAEPRTDQTIYL